MISAGSGTTIAPDELATGLGHWTGGRGPVYRQLAEALKAAVTAGDLLPGRRLPAERQLARELAVSRSTILAAFDVLKREGWLHSRQGSGTTAITLHQAERARAAGAAVTAVIARPGSPLEAVADPVVILPATDTRQHGGSLFEQAALIAADAVAGALQAARGLSDADLAARHDNLQ